MAVVRLQPSAQDICIGDVCREFEASVPFPNASKGGVTNAHRGLAANCAVFWVSSACGVLRATLNKVQLFGPDKGNSGSPHMLALEPLNES